MNTTYGLLDDQGNLNTNNLIKQNAEKKAAIKEVQAEKQKTLDEKKVIEEKKGTIAQPAKPQKTQEEIKIEKEKKREILKAKMQQIRERRQKSQTP